MEKINQNLMNVDYESLKEIWKQECLVITLAYTPTCGTCHVAKKMLQVIKAAMPELNMTQINLNYYGDMAIDLEIMSVPCIMIHKKGKCIEKIYAFESVPFLYKKITSYL